MRLTLCAVIAAGAALSPAWAQQSTPVDPARIEAVISAAFAGAPAEWRSRLVPDATMAACSAHRNNPPKTIFDEIQRREQTTIQYPPDGKFLGDWKKGEALAQSGYGMRFTDYPQTRANGGNCYACHQLTQAEVSYGTIGPSLLGYGKLRKYDPEDTKALYEKIYNSHASVPCSNMPRFGANGILTIDQIKDIVALVMSPDSPVNR